MYRRWVNWILGYQVGRLLYPAVLFTKYSGSLLIWYTVILYFCAHPLVVGRHWETSSVLHLLFSLAHLPPRKWFTDQPFRNYRYNFQLNTKTRKKEGSWNGIIDLIKAWSRGRIVRELGPVVAPTRKRAGWGLGDWDALVCLSAQYCYLQPITDSSVTCMEIINQSQEQLSVFLSMTLRIRTLCFPITSVWWHWLTNSNLRPNHRPGSLSWRRFSQRIHWYKPATETFL